MAAAQQRQTSQRTHLKRLVTESVTHQVFKGPALELGLGGTTSLKTRVEEDPHLAARMEVGDLERATHQGADPRPAGSKRCPRDPLQYHVGTPTSTRWGWSTVTLTCTGRQITSRAASGSRGVRRQTGPAFIPIQPSHTGRSRNQALYLNTPDQSLDQRQSRGVAQPTFCPHPPITRMCPCSIAQNGPPQKRSLSNCP